MMPELPTTFAQAILDATGAASMRVDGVIQDLWSGYGRILRIALTGGRCGAVVAKHVRLPDRQCHPRGWDSGLSHQRKVSSYRVETEWYRHWSARCDERCRVPRFLALARDGDEVLLVLEDLDAAGYPVRLSGADRNQVRLGLAWLAEFHATFMGVRPEGLWEVGTYWHLETRPEELDALDDPVLKQAAPAIDAMLRSATHQSLVHGDAKLANFCFSHDTGRVAAVDFQYVGGGCGIKDVAYFLGSCLDESACERHEAEWLDFYGDRLAAALAVRQPQRDATAVVEEWRALFPVAWTDFHRFMKGWCPGHWKINSYSERLARQVIASL